MTPRDDRAPVWAVIGTPVFAILVVGTVVGLVPYWLSGWEVRRPFAGWAPIGWFGAAIFVAATPVLLDFLVRFVREGHGTPAPFAAPTHLVVKGSFRYVRNPAYVCAVAMVVGQGLFFASGAVLIYGACLAVAFHLFVVLYEEPALRRSFGAEYESYRREVPRWLPRLSDRSRVRTP